MDTAAREDGEITDSDTEVQTTTTGVSGNRVQFPLKLRHDSDDSSSDDTQSDSEDDEGQTALKRLQSSSYGPVDAKKRKLHVWSNVLLEQQLTSDLFTTTTVDEDNISKRVNRGVESYTNRHQINESAVSKNIESDIVAQSDEELFDLHDDGEDRNVKARLGKRKYCESNCSVFEELPEEIDASCDDRTIARFISRGLHEPKIELLHRVSRLFGKDKAIELYRTTLNVEEAGGLIAKTGVRRTPGGVFIFLLKNHKDMTKEIEKDVFSLEKELAARLAKDRRRAKRVAKYGTKGLPGGKPILNADSFQPQTNEDTLHLPSSCTNNNSNSRESSDNGITKVYNSSKNHIENPEDFDLMEEPDIEIGVA